MSLSIVIREHGGPEVLTAVETETGNPAPGEIRLRQTAVAVNFHDIYVRTGLYRTLTLPGIPGLEAAAVVVDVGPGVTGFAAGDRVAYMTYFYGGYARERNLPAELAVKIPAGVDDVTAAAVYLKGLTAEMLARRVHPIKPGETILVHAAAGGVGNLLVQWAVKLGACVIGTAGSGEKLEFARQAGCSHVINYRSENFVDAVREITGGVGVDAVYDSVGRDTFKGSLDCLARCGHLVNFGQSSGLVDAIVPSELFAKSLTLSRPNVFHYAQKDRATLEDVSAALFEGFVEGWLTVPTPVQLPLADAAEAHRRVESRAVWGSLILRP
jgi:NADPH:quinone reductase